jgi:hypothetical protein
MRRKRKKEVSLSEPMSLELSQWDVQRQYNFYRQNFNEKDARQFMLNYATTETQRKNINSQSYLPFSQCWCARLISNGNILPEELVHRLDSFIENLKKETKPVKVEVNYRVSTEVRNERRTLDAYNFVEAQIDSMMDSKGKKEISAESTITVFELAKTQANKIAEWIEEEHLRDFRELASDEELQEGYSFLTKRQQNLVFRSLKKLKEEFLSVKTVQTPEKKKKRSIRIKPIEELLQKLKFGKTAFEFSEIDMKHLIGKRIVYLASESKRTLIRLESKSGIETRSAFLTNIDKAEKIVLYGKNFEKAIRFIVKSKNELMVKKMSKHVAVRRYEPIEIKNNEYRSTEKFCVIQGFIDL